MTLLGFLIFIVCFVTVAAVAFWLINKFAPDPAKMWVMGIVGLILLIVLLAQFVPEAANYRVWK